MGSGLKKDALVNVGDFVLPSLDDPQVIIMVSFQEMTSSGQSTKTRDMLEAYQTLQRSNMRYGEKRVFINFADGGGWLAQKKDFRRLVESCDYFINLHSPGYALSERTSSSPFSRNFFRNVFALGLCSS